jgi:hypothetical protein
MLYTTDRSNELELQYKDKGVVALIWVPPWAIEVFFYHCSYIELDMSFRALEPYVYSIPLAINANESFPLAFIIGQTESVELYSLFFHAMSKIGIPEEDLKAKPFLTDQHKALKAVCEDGTHFICLRHLIENFGSNSFIGQIVRRLAFSSTPAEFDYQSEISFRDIEALKRRHVTFSNVQLKRLCKWFGRMSSSGEPQFDYTVWEQQSIWIRALFGVSTCSNHIEGFHRALNEAARKPRTLAKKLRKILDCIANRYDSASRYQHKQGTKLLTKLKQQQKYLEFRSHAECTDIRCGWKAYYTHLMRVNYFPCVHKVGLKKVVWYNPGLDGGLPLVTDSLEEIEYNGDWTIPEARNAKSITKIGLENEWHRDSLSVSAFLSTLATELSYICKESPPYPHLIATLAHLYDDFLKKKAKENQGPYPETEENRSNFRIDCWLRAKEEGIAVW